MRPPNALKSANPEALRTPGKLSTATVDKTVDRRWMFGER